MMYTQVKECRICGNTNLVEVLDLGDQVLTGVFPSSLEETITEGPLRLVKCHGSDDVCGLLQLQHSYDLSEMYGDNYGYRSGLNQSMVEHLHRKVSRIINMVNLKPGDLVVDIGSNDSTTLQAYPENLHLVGVDPTGVKFRKYYPTYVELIPDFFTSNLIRENFGEKKAKVVTSFSMFYDLEAPMNFMREIHEILDDNGIWVFEQSYMPTMLATNSYDTVCHEHLEFYALKQVQWMADRIGFKIIDVEFNDVNGGSFSITVQKSGKFSARLDNIKKILDKEAASGLDTLVPYQEFASRVRESKIALLNFVKKTIESGLTIAALGASTKGNVLLQYCKFTPEQIKFVGEVNTEKFGHFTPGTLIPIVPEDELLATGVDYLLVLPWHFRKFFIDNKKFSGKKLVFPLPDLSIINL